MKPPVDAAIRRRFDVLAANHPDWSALDIQKQLQKEKLKVSQRTVGRWLQEFRSRPDGEKFEYKFFSWPETMEQGFLPWEASRALLDLVYDLLKNHQGSPEAALYTLPTNLEAKWFWRVSQAAPDLSVIDRANIASQLMAAERFHSPETAKAILDEYRWRLVFEPWKADHERDYELAQRLKIIPKSIHVQASRQKNSTKQKG